MVCELLTCCTRSSVGNLRCIWAWSLSPWAIAVWIGALPMFIAPLAVFATVNWVHIPFEEAKMGRQFGAAYDDYVTRVRRWAREGGTGVVACYFWHISEMAARLAEVRLAGYSGRDLLTLSSSRFDPSATSPLTI
jgi:hypothetical protein